MRVNAGTEWTGALRFGMCLAVAMAIAGAGAAEEAVAPNPPGSAPAMIWPDLPYEQPVRDDLDRFGGCTGIKGTQTGSFTRATGRALVAHYPRRECVFSAVHARRARACGWPAESVGVQLLEVGQQPAGDGRRGHPVPGSRVVFPERASAAPVRKSRFSALGAVL